MELKDQYTAKHCIRVMKLAVGYARYYSLSDYTTNTLKYSAILHDVGKLAISKKILSKTTKLDDKEYKKIKCHPYISYLIVKYMLNLKNEANIIRSHHERIDGKGYPDGLNGSKINDLSKILAVCDAFDAMTSNRVYRKKLSYKEAIDELKTNAGTQFDNKIVSNFCEYINSKKAFK
ncbi:MAG: HD domain-containing protein [Thermoanaerobacteraceae bacterium]|nr:HD domain-containing protein [Thermoanaerobacteraceae bacterium]